MLFLTLFLLCGGVLISTAVETKLRYHPDDYETHFMAFMEKYNKKYVDLKEKLNRFEIFKKTLEKINKQNLESEHAVYEPNQFSDLDKEEFLTHHTGFRRSYSAQEECTNVSRSHLHGGAPASFDWRDQNKVSRVKAQGTCGSCWTFSLMGNIEGQYAIKYNELVEFSEQQLVSCDHRDGGCYGGLMTRGSVELIKMGGVMTDQDYPYVSQDKKNYPCKFNKDKVKTKLSGCNNYVGMNEDTLMDVLHEVGPIAIAVDAGDLINYGKGIMTTCSFIFANHAVLLVGYGSENGIPYWVIKNSWGDDYGEQGYVRVKRGINSCGIINSEIMSAVLE